MTVVGLLLAVMLSAGTAASEDAVDELQTDVERWIKQLDASALAERREAERQLLDLGPRILRWLPPPELIRSASSKEAVKRIRYQLQRRLASDSAKPSRVTLSGEFSLSELLTEITKQTANVIHLGKDIPDAAGKVRTWKFEKATFWEAIDEICRETKLVPTSHPESAGLMLSKARSDQPQPVICRVGALQAALIESHQQPVAGDPTKRLLRLRGELAFEPRLRPLFIHFKSGDFSAADPDGNAIANWNPDARYELPMAGASRHTQLTWDFVTPADAVPKTLSLKGRVLVQLAAATEPIRFDKLATNREVLRRRGGVSVRLHQAEFAGDDAVARSATVKITVNYDTGGPAFESHRTWVYHNAAWLEDSRRRYPFTDFDALGQTDGSVQLEYRFQHLPPPESLKFVYEAPTLLLDVPFDVEFGDVKVK